MLDFIAVYHTAYDSFTWMNLFGGGRNHYAYHCAMSQLVGTLATRLADSQLLPISVSPYAALFHSMLAPQMQRCMTAFPSLVSAFAQLNNTLASFVQAAVGFDTTVADLALALATDSPPSVWRLQSVNQMLSSLDRYFLYFLVSLDDLGTDILWLPQSMISVTSFELTVVDQSIIRSISSSSFTQSELDVLLAQLPLNSMIHIKGLVSVFDPLVPRLRDVHISFSFSLSTSTVDPRSCFSLFACSLSDQSVNQLRQVVGNLTEWNDAYKTRVHTTDQSQQHA